MQLRAGANGHIFEREPDAALPAMHVEGRRHGADEDRHGGGGEEPGRARETPDGVDQIGQHEQADGADVREFRALAGHGVEQEASNADCDEIQHEECMPKRALIGRAPRDQDDARPARPR